MNNSALSVPACPVCGEPRLETTPDINHVGCMTNPELAAYLKYWQDHRDELERKGEVAEDASPDEQAKAARIRYGAWWASTRVSEGKRERARRIEAGTWSPS